MVAMTTSAPVVRADAYHASPKLVVIVVLDQFRGDYLDRYRDDFKTANGFNLFLKKGVHFTDCYYDYANTKTAPGHATIGTGAYTDGHGIGSNEWWDLSRNTDRVISSVEDERYRVVGTFEDLPVLLPPPAPKPTDARIGSSPINLRATTIGDEVRLATGGEAKLFGVSLKDRASILPSGQTANAAFWIDNTTGRFVTSTYYMEKLPEWATKFNKGPRVAQPVKEALSYWYQSTASSSSMSETMARCIFFVASERASSRSCRFSLPMGVLIAREGRGEERSLPNVASSAG